MVVVCRSVSKDSMLQSKQMGRRENKRTNMEGRVIFDLLLVSEMHLNHKECSNFVFAGVDKGLQIAQLLVERRLVPLFGRAKGGRAPLDHF
jgi:hypothetical protein